MAEIKDYFDLSKTYLKKAKDTQRDAIKQTAEMVCKTIQNDGLVQLFGLGSGHAFALELGFRAGGLMGFHRIDPLDLAVRGIIDEAELADPKFNDDVTNVDKLLGLYRIDPRDNYIFISYAGNEPLIVETAIRAKQEGRKVVAVISKELSDHVRAKHESGKKLADVADIVIDICAPYPDALFTLDGKTYFNQISTVCGNAIAQMVTAEAYRYLVEHNLEAPVLLSANIRGADAHNKVLSDRYAGRWNS